MEESVVTSMQCSLISALLFAVTKLSDCILEAHTTPLCALSLCAGVRCNPIFRFFSEPLGLALILLPWRQGRVALRCVSP